MTSPIHSRPRGRRRGRARPSPVAGLGHAGAGLGGGLDGRHRGLRRPRPGERADRGHDQHRFGDAAVGRRRRGRVRAGRPRLAGLHRLRQRERAAARATSSSSTIGDDQYDPALTPGVVNGLHRRRRPPVRRDHRHAEQPRRARHPQRGVHPAAQRAQPAIPRCGEVADYPWTTGLLMSYEYEFGGYAEDIAENFPDAHGRRCSTSTTSSARSTSTASEDAADEAGLEIVDEQTIEPATTRRRRRSCRSIAEARPGRHHGGAARRPVRHVPQRAGQRQGGQPRLGAAASTSPTRAPAR